MTGTDKANRWSTIAAVPVVGLDAASVSHRHALETVGQHGESGWLDAVYPLTVDELIYPSNMVLLNDPGAGSGRTGWLTRLSGSASRQRWR